jgi:hypothetical protein
LIKPGSTGLNAPRTILKRANGNLLVTSWRGNRVLEYSSNGTFIRTVTAAVSRPTGMAFESDEVLLLASDASNDISRVQISDGTVLEKLITFNDGLLSGPTFILVLEKLTSDLVQNRAFWTIGVGEIQNKSIVLDEMYFTSGGAFGQAFDPNDISNVLWGSVIIEFNSCDGARVSWSPSQAEFEAGAYDVFRLADDPFGDSCKATGFGSVVDSLWMSGLWFGGAARDGEGFSINIINGELAVVTWYTYLPVDVTM